MLIKNREIALGKAAVYKKLIGSKTQALSVLCFYPGAADYYRSDELDRSNSGVYQDTLSPRHRLALESGPRVNSSPVFRGQQPRPGSITSIGLLWVALRRWYSGCAGALRLLKPETVVCWLPWMSHNHDLFRENSHSFQTSFYVQLAVSH